MSTIKSSAENLTLNADGANNDVIIQSNGSTLVTVDGATGGVGIGTTVINKIFNISDPAQGGETVKLHFEASASSDKFAIYTYDRTNGHYADLSLGQSSIYIHGSGGVVSAQYGIELGSGTDATAANTLDDYEEGSFTPTVYGTGTAGSPTYTSQFGKYTKIGNVVSCYIRITTSALGGIAGDVRLGNLPFTSEATSDVFSSAACGYAAGLAITSDTSLSGWVANGSTYIKVTSWDRTVGTSYLQGSEWTDDGTLMISVVYHT